MRVAILCVALLASCSWGGMRIDKPFAGGAENIKATSEEIDTKAAAGTALVADGQVAAPDWAGWPKLASIFDDISAGAKKLIDYTAALRASERECAKLKAERDKANDKAAKADRDFWWWVRSVSLLLLVAAMVAAFYPAFAKLAPIGFIAGGSGLGIATFMLSYSWIVNLIVGVSLAVGAAVLVWALIRHVRRMDRQATEMASQARDVSDPGKPEVTMDSFLEHWATKIPLLRLALNKLKEGKP